MKKYDENIDLTFIANRFEYDYRKSLDDFILSKRANEFLNDELNFAIEKMLVDAKKIAKENDDKTLIRSYLQQASKKVFKKRSVKYSKASGILGSIFISITLTFIPGIIDGSISRPTIIYVLLATLIGSILLTYSIFKK